MKYSMTCTCGDVLTVEAKSRKEAVEMLRDMMTQEAINAHFADKHPGEKNIPTKAEEDIMIDQTVREDTTARMQM